MGRSVAETISDATRIHLLNNNGLLFGQCVTAVGWVGGTIPQLSEDDGIVELALSDSSNGGIAVGAALAGRRPIYVIRYQGFMWYNSTSLVNYAAKSMELWNQPCPVFIRSIAMEGGIGPVATSSEHSMVMRKSGLPVYAPMTPNEWTEGWNWFLENDSPLYCSEHRKSFGIRNEMVDIENENPHITIFGISAARLSISEAIVELNKSGISCDFFNIKWLKPFSISENYLKSLNKSNVGLIVDSDNSICGASRSMAYEIMLKSGKPVHALGVEDRTAGFASHLDNGTPSKEEVIREVLNIVKSK